MTVDGEGVSNHLGAAGSTDRDADADHVAVAGPVCPACGGYGRVVNPGATGREALEGLSVDRCAACGGFGTLD